MPDNDIDILEVHYHDGKPEVEKHDISKEIHKELHKGDCKCNDADITKSALYAGLPKAKQKRDKSLNARAISSMIESFNKQRNEAKFSVRKQGDDTIITVNKHTFLCTTDKGIINILNDFGKVVKSISDKNLKGAPLDKYLDKTEELAK